MGCRFGQGYLFARPVGAAAIEALLGEGAGFGRVSDGAAKASADDPALMPEKRLRLVSGD
jgi:F0F1-type ATP synthase membrane subunit c/vacuolar-type H+-ATPase subunit K